VKAHKNSFLQNMEKEFEDGVCKAFTSGSSVIEITRLIGKRKAMYVYKLLQRKRLIGNSLKRSKCIGPASLQKELKRAGISFVQWCNCWTFDPGTAEMVLLQGDGELGGDCYWDAARRDFPKSYKPTTNKTFLDLDEWDRESAAEAVVHSYHLDWDPKLGHYVGTIPDIPSLQIIGKRPSDVLFDLVRAAWLEKSILRLKEAPL